MRMTRLHAPTLKEAPKDADVVSHALLVRGGFVRKLAAGIYDFLPLGVRSLHKVERIVREELNRAGAQEVYLPAVCPAELWQESGRWQKYGPELLRFKDRKGADFCFGPTHEEVITDLVRRDVRSYRDLPVTLYQIQVKYRDEIRPRFGLMRGREFIMKDAYSFDVDEERAHASYRAMYHAYCRIFARCGFRFRSVEADTGAIGGSLSHEFQVLAETGEDAILTCRSCGYTANVEKVEIAAPSAAPAPPTPHNAAPEKVETPTQRTIEEVTEFLGVGADRLVKTLLYLADGEPVAFLVRGDHELNEPKAKAACGAGVLEMADEATVRRVTGAAVGFAGPVGLPAVPLFADHALRSLGDLVTGANETGWHVRGVYLERDARALEWADLRVATTADACPRCGAGAAYEEHRGIEVGHVFFLGTKYSQAMSCTFLAENGEVRPAVMGCYGIGVSRILAAAIEQSHDDDGIVWPAPLAPYQVVVLPLNMDDPAVVAAAEDLYGALQKAGVEVLLDDRDERPGAKFKDADLIGMPFQVVLGKRSLKDGVVEVKRRGQAEKTAVPLPAAAERLTALVRDALAAHDLPEDWTYSPTA
jgi:prolyl-tRNA synthetase